MTRKEIFLFFFFLVLAIFFSGIFGFYALLTPNFFLMAPLFILLKSRHLSVAYLFIFSGFTADVLSGTFIGIHAISFFVSFFIAYYLLQIMDVRNRGHLTFIGSAVSLTTAFIQVFLLFIFWEQNFWKVFFRQSLWSEVLPTALLTVFFGQFLFTDKNSSAN